MDHCFSTQGLAAALRIAEEELQQPPGQQRPPQPQQLSLEPIEIPITLSDEQRMLLSTAKTGISMFITGKAGTGKTTLLREVIKTLVSMYGVDHVFVTSSTGISACQIEGTTVHSFAGIGLGEEPVAELVKKMFPPARKRWALASALIIDEISMLRPDTFDKIEEIARLVRHRQAPFGGIQVITCGDFYQLAPVYKDNETVKYCFEANSWHDVIKYEYELKTVFRQRDERFLSLLEDVRYGNLSEKSKEILATCIRAQERTCTPVQARIKPTLLRSKRLTAQDENYQELMKLTTPGMKSTADDWAASEYLLRQLKDNCQAPEVLYMRVGAQVMLLKNLSVERHLCNGSTGVIVAFVNDEPEVEFPSCTLVIPKMDFEVKSGKDVLSRRRQFPLNLGWAVTIHKSQGMTLDRADVELSNLFASGQGYTALSRVRTLEHAERRDDRQRHAKSCP